MALIGQLVVDLVANTVGFAANMKRAQTDVTGLKSALAATNATASAFGGALASVGLGVGGLFAAGTALHEFAQQQEAVAQLNATLKSTGGAAGLTSAEIQKLAAGLQQTTTFADDATISAASVLATFTQIKGDIFKDAIAAAQDMSVKFGTDLHSTIIQVGKALNDPIKGVTALRRVGVSFTQSQLDQIKALVQSGDTLKAQKIILQELSTEFGGAAAAAAGTFGGQLKQVKHFAGDLAEEFGGMLAPFVSDMANAIKFAMQYKGVIVALTGAALAFTAALKAWAVGQAIVLGLSGPAGWGVLIAGAAATGAAIYAIGRSMSASETEAKKAAAGVKQYSAQVANLGDKLAKVREEAEKFLSDETLKLKISIDEHGLSDAEKKFNELARKVKEKFKDVDEYRQRDPSSDPVFLKRKAELEQKARDAAARGNRQAANEYLLESERPMFALRSDLEIERLRRLHDQNEALNKQAEVQKKLNELAQENAEFGKKDEEKRYDELKRMGASAEQLAKAKKDMDEIAQKRAAKEADDKAKAEAKRIADARADLARKVYQDTMLPIEEYRQTILKLQSLNLDSNTRRRGVAEAFDKLRTDSKREPVAFLEKGSQAALAAINAAKNDPIYSLDETSKKALAVAEEARDYQRDAADVLKNLKAFSIEAA